MDSWVGTGPNGRYEVATAIDAQTLEAHSRQSGCSRQELIARITTDLPDAINQMTQTATCQQITERMPRTG
ncbi:MULTISPECIES: YidB family protein [unclassified Mesorhizobium]|uniref:YidB family protein n=1 Tax=unclassified Mesorhizobium TaxID=325217 RepID=UPI001FEDCD6C|nr:MULTISPECIES: YidB family protein [unclassified Mesorhizobium]